MLSALILCLALPAAEPGTRGAGFVLGINFARLTGDDVPDGLDTRVRYALGGYLRLPLALDGVTFEPGLLYNQKGARGGVGSNEVTITLDYLEVPLLFAAGLPASDSADLRFALGPSLAYNVIAESGGDSTGSLADETRDLEASLVMTGGLVLWLVGGPSLLVEMRYAVGLTSIDDTSPNGDIHNRTLSFIFGLGT